MFKFTLVPLLVVGFLVTSEALFDEQDQILANLADPNKQSSFLKSLNDTSQQESIDLEARCELEQDNVKRLHWVVSTLQARKMSSPVIEGFSKDYKSLVDEICAKFYEVKLNDLLKQVEANWTQTLDYHMGFMANLYAGQPKRLDQVSCDFDQVTGVLEAVFNTYYGDRMQQLIRPTYYKLEVQQVIQECDRFDSLLGDLMQKRIRFSRDQEEPEAISWALKYKFCQVLTSEEENFGQLIDNKWLRIGKGGEKLLELFKYLTQVTVLDAHQQSLLDSLNAKEKFSFKGNNGAQFIGAFEKLVKSSGKSKTMGISRKKLVASEAQRFEQLCKSVATTFNGHLWLQSVGYEADSMSERREKILTLAQVCKSVGSIQLASEIVNLYESSGHFL